MHVVNGLFYTLLSRIFFDFWKRNTQKRGTRKSKKKKWAPHVVSYESAVISLPNIDRLITE